MCISLNQLLYPFDALFTVSEDTTLNFFCLFFENNVGSLFRLLTTLHAVQAFLLPAAEVSHLFPRLCLHERILLT